MPRRPAFFTFCVKGITQSEEDSTLVVNHGGGIGDQVRIATSGEPRGTSMEMHQIRYFLALCEELNFTRAARRCGVTQPSLTNAIRALEGELGGALFQRKPRIVLTELGAAIRPYLVEIDR